ncbi:MAG: hypothetical protein KDH96_00410 [Candidatus Riesia sp.]|nr:hypothetical protein [Candidatus Riesia sp.]
MEDNRIRTYRDLTVQIKGLLDRQGAPSTSSRFSEYLIYDTILDERTSYLKRTKVQRQGIGQQNIQTIACVKLEDADTNISPGQPPSGCRWLKSVKPIPKVINLTSVTNSNANFKADYVEWSQYKTKLYSRSNTKETRYYTFLDTGEGSYLYLYNDDFLENVSLTGLWENPNHAAYYTDCDETDRQKFLRCNPFETPLYMDGDIVDVVFKMTFDFLVRSTPASGVDIDADSLENSGGVPQTKIN